MAETTAGSSYPELIAGNGLTILPLQQENEGIGSFRDTEAARLPVTSELLSGQNPQSLADGYFPMDEKHLLAGTHMGLTPLPCPSPCHRYPRPEPLSFRPLELLLLKLTPSRRWDHHCPLRLLGGRALPPPSKESALPLILRSSRREDALATALSEVIFPLPFRTGVSHDAPLSLPVPGAPRAADGHPQRRPPKKKIQEVLRGFHSV